MSLRRRFKALDGRTGRLERAVNLIEDGEARGLKVARREADKPHPLSNPSPIPVDRATIVAGMRGPKKSEDQQFAWVIGYTSTTDFWGARGGHALALYSGGCVITFTEDTTYYILLGDGTSRLLLGDGGGLIHR